MRFVFCCILSLGLLYAVILRDQGYLVDPAQTAQRMARSAWAAPRLAGETTVTVAGPQIAARVEAYCRHDPSACLAVAATLAAPAPRRAARVSLGAGAP